MKKLTLLLLVVFLVPVLGCSSEGEADSRTTVQHAVEKYLATRTDLANMQVIVESVSYDGDRANAAVTIVARKDPQAKMQMMYRLRKTNTGWEVEPKQASEAGAHGGAAPLPESGAGSADLPPGHPPVGGAGGTGGATTPELPPGHPPVGGRPSGQSSGSGAPQKP